MTATVTRLPVVRKRGRKVALGPKAEIVPLYSPSQQVANNEMHEANVSGVLAESFADKERDLLDRIRASSLERAAQREAWLDLSPNVSRFPDAARFRSVALVNRLLEGGEDIEPEVKEARQQFLAEVAARRAEIVATLSKRTGAVEGLAMLRPEDRERAETLLKELGRAMCKLPRKE